MNKTVRYATSDDDDNRILQDGETLIVPLRLRDAWRTPPLRDALGGLAGHRPGVVLASDQRAADAASDKRYGEYVKSLQDAWRAPGTEIPASSHDGSACSSDGHYSQDRNFSDDARARAWQRYVYDTENAWRAKS